MIVLLISIILLMTAGLFILRRTPDIHGQPMSSTKSWMRFLCPTDISYQDMVKTILKCVQGNTLEEALDKLEGLPVAFSTASTEAIKKRSLTSIKLP